MDEHGDNATILQNRYTGNLWYELNDRENYRGTYLLGDHNKFKFLLFMDGTEPFETTSNNESKINDQRR